MIAIAVLIVSVLNLRIPYYAITPGPAFDVVDLITIDDVQTKKVSGELLLTTVRLHEIKVGEAIRAMFDDDYELLSKASLIPSGETEKDADERSTQQMAESQQNAAAAALDLLGYDVRTTPLGARVSDFYNSPPAQAVLERGDVIVGADAASVKRSQDLVAVINRHKIGEDISLKIRRDGQTLTVKTRTVPSGDVPQRPVIGVILETFEDVKVPLAIKINALNIGGPSAGLMYALGIVDLLDDSDIAAKRRIAGTGEIAIDGTVGPVGGIEQKIAAALHEEADLFLVPSIELDQACARAEDMPVYAVNNLKEAIRVLRDARFAQTRDCS